MSEDFHTSNRDAEPIELTPLIDVILQLLIFFMLSSTFLYPSLELQLPSSEFNEVSDDTPTVVVSIEATGDLYINRNMVEEATFREAVVAELDEQEDRAIFLNADKSVPYERVLTVIRMVSEAGGEQINFLYQSEE